MARLHYATHLNMTDGNLLRRLVTYSITDWRVSAYALILVSFFLILVSSRAHGDEFTGLPHGDPKDLGSSPVTTAPPPPTTSCDPFALAPATSFFAPLPSWAHGTIAALPYQLTPFGRKPVEVAANKPAVESLAPPKEATPVPAVSTPMPPPKPAPPQESPALVAVSPFLQWVKANPQAAAAEARQQAASENAQTPTGPTTATTAPSPAAQAAPAPAAPYWLPPLIDSGEFGGSPGGSSAAIYSTPQR